MDNVILEVDRADHAATRLTSEQVPEPGVGQVVLRVDRFALTANNITYASAGDLLGYWAFFPAEDGWGRVPAMGWAEVVASSHPDIEPGSRYYGWYPMAQYVIFDARATADGFRDDGAHRSAHAPVYRSYVRTDRDSWYDPATDGEDRHALLRGLFLTSLLADEFFADEQYFGAAQALVLSASSKTAIGFAQRAAGHDLDVVGLTSDRNVAFVESLGWYDRVVSYSDIDGISVVDSVLIDMAGSVPIVAKLHDLLGNRLRYSMLVGMSHHDSTQAPIESGPAPEWFFAPTEVTRRLDEWGRAEYERRTADALRSFVDGSRAWLEVEVGRGPDAGEETWRAVYEGEVAPNVGRIVSMHQG